MQFRISVVFVIAVLILVFNREAMAIEGVCVENCGGGGGGWGRGNTGGSYTPPARDYEAERREREAIEDAERQRRKKLEAERAAEEKRKQDEFDKKKNEALRDMKGLSPEKRGLKGDPDTGRNSPIFGIKGVSDGAIAKTERDDDTREVQTAWQRLNCAVELAGIAVEKISTGTPDFDEAVYLNQEALNALQGSPKGVKCSKASEPPKPYGQKELDGTKDLLRKVVQSNLVQIETIVKADKEIEENKKKEAVTKGQVEKLKRESEELKQEAGRLKKEKEAVKPMSPQQEKKKPENDAIAKAYEEQKAFQKQEEEKIKEVAKKQKEKQKAMEEALAAMRELQRAINHEKSRKQSATGTLRENKAKADELVKQLNANTGGR